MDFKTLAKTYALTLPLLDEGKFAQLYSYIPGPYRKIVTEVCYEILHVNPLMDSELKVIPIRFAAESEQITTIHIPSHCTAINSCAFYYCFELQDVVMEPGVTNIESRAFYGCGHLQSVTLSASLRKIGLQAFAGCQKLMRIELPTSLEIINGHAFDACNQLSDIIYTGTIKQFKKINIAKTAFPSTCIIRCIDGDYEWRKEDI